jgi:hypothetical protein
VDSRHQKVGSSYSRQCTLDRRPDCTGTWLSLAAVAVYRPRPVREWATLDYLVMVMMINGLAMLPVLIIKKAVGMRVQCS